MARTLPWRLLVVDARHGRWIGANQMPVPVPTSNTRWAQSKRRTLADDWFLTRGLVTGAK